MKVSVRILPIVIAVWALATTLPDLRQLWLPLGDFGFGSNGNGRVVLVIPKGAAAAAGVVVGDVIDTKVTNTKYRTYIGAPVTVILAPGLSITLAVIHAGQLRWMTLRAKEYPTSPTERIILVLSQILNLVFVAIGLLVILRRRNLMTWGFYLFCLAFGPGVDGGIIFWDWVTVHTPNLLPILGFLITAGVSALTFGILIFALRFPSDSVSGWRRTVEHTTPYLFFGLAGLSVYAWMSHFYHGASFEWGINFEYFFYYGIIAIAIFALLDTFRRTSGEERQRVKWVITGFLVGLSANVIFGILDQLRLMPYHPDWLTQAASILTVIAPLSATYAIIRHRVLDVNFVVSRTLAYTLLTSLIISMIALADWFFHHSVEATGFGIFPELCAAVVIGFGVNALHKRIDAFVDDVFFRRRRLAQENVARVAGLLPYAESHRVVDELLVARPTDALDLESAAIFGQLPSGSFERGLSIGWPEESVRILAHDGELVLHLRADPKPLRLSEVRWMHDELPKNAARPALAMPVVTRRKINAIVLYGGHKNGADLDPEEVRVICGLAVSASAAYDHLEVQLLRQRVDALEQENATLRASPASLFE